MAEKYNPLKMNLRSQFYSKFANDHRIIDFVKLKCCTYCEKCNSGRTMKCSRITLFDRKEIQTKNFNHKHSCYYERTFQPQLENYLSWLNKPYNVFEEEQPYLTVCNIALPNNAMVFVDRGAQSDRWVHKRPRLRSAMQRKSARKSVQEFDANDDDEKTHNSEEEKDSEIMEIQQVLQEYEIDENVQRLIQEAADYDRKIEQLTENPNDPEETDKRRHKKHKTKETRNNDTKERAKVRLNRTMTVSLSRPPSPETIQVIRVDVTSNYSMEELNHRLCLRKTHDSNNNDDDDDDDDDDDGNEENSDDFYDDGDDESESTKENDKFRNERQTGNEKAHARNQQLVDNNETSNRLYSRKTLMKIEGFSTELTVQCQKLALADRRSDVNVN